MAGYSGSNDAHKKNGGRTANRPDVIVRVHELQREHATRLNMTVDDHIARLLEMYELARRKEQPANGIAAVWAMAKILGHITDRRETTEIVHKPSPILTTVVELTEEQWLEQFSPKNSVP